MRVLAMAGLMAMTTGCAALPTRAAEAPVVIRTAASAPRASREEMLAAYWAERRSPRPLLVSDFLADFSARRPAIGQNFPESHDSEDQSRLNVERLERESAATRAAVRAALGR